MKTSNKTCGYAEKSVGLLGNAKGINAPFLCRDTRYHQRIFADFIHGVSCCALTVIMFNMACLAMLDAGCTLHAGPAWSQDDLQEPWFERKNYDKVSLLLKNNNAFLWGEHGQRRTLEYRASPSSGNLYPSMLQQVKGRLLIKKSIESWLKKLPLLLSWVLIVLK